MSRLNTYARLGLDLARWWRRTAGLRAAPVPPAKGVLLVCDLLTSYVSVKAQAVLARAARAQGLDTVVVLMRPWRLAEKAYACAGPVRFLYLEDFMDDGLRAQAQVQAERLLADDPRFEKLLDLDLDGIRVGRNVLSIVLRHLRQGRIDPDDPGHRALVAQRLTESLVTKAASERLLAAHPASLALFNERGYTPAGEFFDACLARGIPAVQWLGAPQADRLLFKRYTLANRAQHPLALSEATCAKLRASPWTRELEDRIMAQMTGHYDSGAWYNRQQLQTGKHIKPPEEVRRQLGLDPAKKTAAIFCHILYDATFFYGDSLYVDYEQWLVEAVRGAIANPSLNWVVKVHPVNVWRSRMDGQPMEQLEVQALTRAFGPLPDHIRIMPADTDVNTLSLFNSIDYGLTVRGTVGMELPCFGVPVVTAGTGRYSGQGFTMDPASPADFQALLARLHEIPPLDAETMELARRYAYGTFFLRPVPFHSFQLDFNADGKGVTALNQNLWVAPGIKPDSPDLAALGRWLAHDDTADYLTEGGV